MKTKINDELEKKGPIRPTGRGYSSVKELMEGENVSREVRDRVTALESETRLTHLLTCLRMEAGLNQQEMAQKMAVTQSAVSKLENQPDEDLKISEIRDYVRITGRRVELTFGRPLNHVESVKSHALSMRDHLSALAALAHHDPAIEEAIQRFFSEAFFNILDILGKCQQERPGPKNNDLGMKVLAGPPKRTPDSETGSLSISDRITAA